MLRRMDSSRLALLLMIEKIAPSLVVGALVALLLWHKCPLGRAGKFAAGFAGAAFFFARAFLADPIMSGGGGVSLELREFGMLANLALGLGVGLSLRRLAATRQGRVVGVFVAAAFLGFLLLPLYEMAFEQQPFP